MKAETAQAIAQLAVPAKQELVAYLADLMRPADFTAALCKPGNEELTENGIGIADSLFDIVKRPDATDIVAEVDRLHEAIAEGRRQDAVDILNDTLELPLRLRSVSEHMRLFPNRIEL